MGRANCNTYLLMWIINAVFLSKKRNTVFRLSYGIVEMLMGAPRGLTGLRMPEGSEWRAQPPHTHPSQPPHESKSGSVARARAAEGTYHESEGGSGLLGERAAEGTCCESKTLSARAKVECENKSSRGTYSSNIKLFDTVLSGNHEKTSRYTLPGTLQRNLIARGHDRKIDEDKCYRLSVVFLWP
ncbi:hypothetical protein JB92DRAFT_2827775 [Gautieria morchelliformis]|nr:hypothetical protein JB92DRAFT_2827775 [Gautieria morchelliformis]